MRWNGLSGLVGMPVLATLARGRTARSQMSVWESHHFSQINAVLELLYAGTPPTRSLVLTPGPAYCLLEWFHTPSPFQHPKVKVHAILSREAACSPSSRTRPSGDVSPPCCMYPRGTRLRKAKYTCSASTAPMTHLLWCALSCPGGVRLWPTAPAVHAYSPSTTILAQLAHIKLVDDARNVRSLHMNMTNFTADPTLNPHSRTSGWKGDAKGQEAVAVTSDGVTWLVLLSQLIFFTSEKPGESRESSMEGHIHRHSKGCPLRSPFCS